MKRSTLFLLFAGVTLALPFTAAAMNNQDVIKMHKAGLSEETILVAMEKEDPEYDTSTDALIELKSSGISERVIQKMLTLGSRRSTSTASTSTSASSTSSSTANAEPASTSAASAFNGSGGSAFYQEFPSIAPAKIQPVVGKDYFTRYTFHVEKNEHSTTNYARGSIVPINTPVKLLSMSGDKLVLVRGDAGEEVEVENVEKYTRKSITEIASLMLSAEKTPLERLPDEVAAAVRNGEMRKGMTKELVLMTRGYPPAHETPSLERDRWVYWSSRFVKHTIVFANGRLIEGRGLY